MQAKMYKVLIQNGYQSRCGIVEAFSEESACYIANYMLNLPKGVSLKAELMTGREGVSAFECSFYYPFGRGITASDIKSINNAIAVKNLAIGDKVRVKKTGKIGVVVKFIMYPDTEAGRLVPYISVGVRINGKFRSYSGTSLEKI